jgi:predicted Zn finger-like uncharacterized protein
MGASRDKGADEGTIVAIQCPSCKTKFGVDSAVLGQVARPRFHCSRCDTTFSKSLASIMTALSRASGGSQHGMARSGPRMQPRIHPPLERTDSFVAPRVPARYRESVTEMVNQPVGFKGAKSPLAQGELYATDQQSLEPLDQDPLTPISDEGTSEAVVKRQIDSETRSVENGVDYRDGRGEESRLGSADDHPSKTIQATDKRSDKVEDKNTTTGQSPISQSRSFPLSPISQVAIALSPAIVLIIILAGLSIGMMKSPKQIVSQYPGVFETALHFPPAELQIQQPALKSLMLDSGESVYVVTGRVINRSTDTFSRIQVQALTFDDQGTPLQSAIAGAGGMFSAARISSFSAEKNAELQKESLTEKMSAESQKVADFRIILPQHTPLPEFFSVRVYGVVKAE